MTKITRQSGCLFIALLLYGAQSVQGFSSAPQAPTFSNKASQPDVDLDQGAPIRLIGKDQIHSQAGYVTAAKDPGKKLWCLTTNLFAVKSADGQVVMKYSGSGEISIDADLKNIKGPFGGYPSVIYGCSPWSKTIAAGQGAEFPLPIRQIKALTADIAYSLNYERFSGNIAYDLWLTEDPAPDDPTNGVEVMIWLLGRKTTPLGAYERTDTKLIKVNSAIKNARFLVYLAPRDRDRKTDVVSFVIDRFSAIQSGEVEVDLLDFIKTTLSLVRRSDKLCLQGVEYGIEFANLDQEFSLKINKYQIKQEFFTDHGIGTMVRK